MSWITSSSRAGLFGAGAVATGGAGAAGAGGGGERSISKRSICSVGMSTYPPESDVSYKRVTGPTISRRSWRIEKPLCKIARSAAEAGITSINQARATSFRDFNILWQRRATLSSKLGTHAGSTQDLLDGRRHAVLVIGQGHRPAIAA